VYETGWKVEAQLRWFWAVVTGQITFCEIYPALVCAASVHSGSPVRGLVDP
jgi:hypothetical protein